MHHQIVFDTGNAHPNHDRKHKAITDFALFIVPGVVVSYYTIRELVKGGSVVNRMYKRCGKPLRDFFKRTDEIFSPERRKSRRRCSDANLTVLLRINC